MTILQPILPKPFQFKPGDLVSWEAPAMGLCVGHISGAFPTGYTAYRLGVRQTKPHFLDLSAPRRCSWDVRSPTTMSFPAGSCFMQCYDLPYEAGVYHIGIREDGTQRCLQRGPGSIRIWREEISGAREIPACYGVVTNSSRIAFEGYDFHAYLGTVEAGATSFHVFGLHATEQMTFAEAPAEYKDQVSGESDS